MYDKNVTIGNLDIHNIDNDATGVENRNINRFTI